MEKEKTQKTKERLDELVEKIETGLMLTSFVVGTEEETANYFVERMEKLINKINYMIETTKEIGKIASEINKDKQEGEIKENQDINRD